MIDADNLKQDLKSFLVILNDEIKEKMNSNPNKDYALLLTGSVVCSVLKIIDHQKNRCEEDIE